MYYFKNINSKQIHVFLLLLNLSLFSGAINANAAGQWKDGSQVYAKVCSYCHDTNIGPIIKGTDKPVEYIQIIIRNGFRAMPAFRGSEINDEELKKLADFIKSSAP
jgi:cytochrome c5